MTKKGGLRGFNLAACASERAWTVLCTAWPPATAAQMACWMLLSRTTSGRAESGWSREAEVSTLDRIPVPRTVGQKANPQYRSIGFIELRAGLWLPVLVRFPLGPSHAKVFVRHKNPFGGRAREVITSMLLHCFVKNCGAESSCRV